MTKVVLLYPPQQSDPKCAHKPEASLAYPYLAGALLRAGHSVKIYDACVGNDLDDPNVFYSSTELESGLYRYGVTDERILDEVADSDVVGITSIFTSQESMALYVGRLIKSKFPEKVLVCGGTNARSRPNVFLDAGFDAVCMAEAESDIVYIANLVKKKFALIKYPFHPTLYDLDQLPIPAWELHANQRYWNIARPHGACKEGTFKHAPIMTSRGCVFKCSYCHISGEDEISTFRVKSISRVLTELGKLKDLGVEELFIEDDTLFGHKRRGIDLLKRVRKFGFNVWNINGINIPHLFKKGLLDFELLDVLQECGFKAVSLPVESGNQRILDKYASRKWQISRFNICTLIKALAERGIKSGVNYMLGYPDETLEEIENTIALARTHIEAGASSANFMLVIPLPGTELFEMAIREGYLDKDFNPDSFTWRRANMKNTTVDAKQLEEIHQRAYAELNSTPSPTA